MDNLTRLTSSVDALFIYYLYNKDPTDEQYIINDIISKMQNKSYIIDIYEFALALRQGQHALCKSIDGLMFNSLCDTKSFSYDTKENYKKTVIKVIENYYKFIVDLGLNLYEKYNIKIYAYIEESIENIISSGLFREELEYRDLIYYENKESLNYKDYITKYLREDSYNLVEEINKKS